LKSIGAALADMLAIVVLSVGTDAVPRATGIFPPLGQPMGDTLFLLAAAWRNNARLNKLLLPIRRY